VGECHSLTLATLPSIISRSNSNVHKLARNLGSLKRGSGRRPEEKPGCSKGGFSFLPLFFLLREITAQEKKETTMIGS